MQIVPIICILSRRFLMVKQFNICSVLSVRPLLVSSSLPNFLRKKLQGTFLKICTGFFSSSKESQTLLTDDNFEKKRHLTHEGPPRPAQQGPNLGKLRRPSMTSCVCPRYLRINFPVTLQKKTRLKNPRDPRDINI